jgi:fibronectin type 3 domain-containing protein
MASAPSLTYVVYRVSPEGPVRLTEKPVSATSFTDGGAEFGVERCYDVRTVTAQGVASFESTPSPTACVTPADTFPPPAPRSLAAVAGEGAISLIWEGVDAPDLAGYLVLRGEAPSGELKPIFEAPIRESTYRDTTAKSGVRYVYAVVAVDRATPPNRSTTSNKVEETAR